MGERLERDSFLQGLSGAGSEGEGNYNGTWHLAISCLLLI